ncbi:RNA polymerase sigma factor [Naasia aerilata]|uniref:RNA polymerase sigma factor n=1 Tax=Naasia aerilata TaxID=1162966 RepID=UPI002573C461|nr:RNA polymerase sigma factor [Naasia aerilata]
MGAVDDTPAEPSDIALLREADSGQSYAFGLLYDRHKRRVLNACYRIVAHREDAEDAAALVFLETWRRRAVVRDIDGSILPWLLATSVNVGRTLRRNRGRYRTFLGGLHPEDGHVSEADSVDRRLERAAALGPTWAAFAKLNAKEQTILLLCVVEELPQEEVAATLGIPVGTVKSRLSRAKERLRRQMELDESLGRERAPEGRR